MKKNKALQMQINADDMAILKYLADDYMCKEIAKFLHLCPSSISHRISKMSELYGYDIIERQGANKRRVKLTTKGKRLANRAKKTLEVWEA
jgi:DNA-binding MarR family transcriptional regulator